MAITAHNLNSPPAVVAEAPARDAALLFRHYGKDTAYNKVLRWSARRESEGKLDLAAYWENVAALIDAMSPCERECGRPGVGYFNNVFCCQECGERNGSF